ncbi:hypothetical protein BRC88_00950 [Halobacteriales archaeon QS_4_69_225]|nr:MAG: hypothetical protein BRC88_00950 [Halobacteriales archaeon QS_4_69_225]
MTDSCTGADLFVDALERYGVGHVFGNPGTTELPIVDALSGTTSSTSPGCRRMSPRGWRRATPRRGGTTPTARPAR